MFQRAHCNASAARYLDTHSVTAGTRPGALRLEFPPLRWMLFPARAVTELLMRRKPHGELPGLIKWKDANSVLAKQAPERARTNAATGLPAAPKAQGTGPSAEQMDMNEGWNHVRVCMSTKPPPPFHPLNKIPLLNRSRGCPSSLKCPPPGRQPLLRSLSPNLQQLLNRLLGS